MCVTNLNQTLALKIGIAVLLSILSTTSCLAGELKLRVNSKADKPLGGVVITLEPLGEMSAETMRLNPLQVNIEQIDREFVPAITVVPLGSSVSFPNQDDILHHVYSFSEAKTFDLPLYKGIPNDPVKFDRAGIATLGCNIHDWMSAHVLVVDTPYYQQTNELGKSHLLDVAEGDYELMLWHPRQRKPYTEVISITAQTLEKTIELRLKPSFRSKRNNSKSNRNY